MSFRELELTDFRIFHSARFVPEKEGTTLITGGNGTGKTSVLEALGYLGTKRSFRNTPPAAMIRTGAPQAVLRAAVEGPDSPISVEAEIRHTGSGRARVNGKAAAGRKALATAAPSTVFSPEDLVLVGGGPGGRRDLLDDALSLLDLQGARAADEVDRVLRQRGALLRQAGGSTRPEVVTSLDVWDQRLADAGEVLVTAREALVGALSGLVAEAYFKLAGGIGCNLVTISYVRSWEGGLHDAVAAARREDLRRGINTVGPHRDDLLLQLEGREARTHASQGEQRCLSLGLRLGVHQLVCARSVLRPTLLLDDVFAGLDRSRSRALVEALPSGQAIVTSALPLAAEMPVAREVSVEELLVP
jgi:DNA replication and repair protein RecF